MGLESSSEAERRAGSPRAVRVFLGAVAVALLALVATKVLLPLYFAPPTVAEREAALNTAFTEVGTALEVWKQREGAYPERLEQLVPGDLASIPADPWHPEASPLRYEVRGSAGEASTQSVLLYSVGENGVDDGGVAGLDGSRNGDRLYPVW